MPVKLNALDQALDIAGSLLQSDVRTLSDEPNARGRTVQATTVTSVTFGAPSGNIQTLSGLSGFTAQSIGGYITTSGASNGGNNGTFLIVAYNSATSINISNASGVSEGPTSTTWTERRPYMLEDDINFARTDRKSIKGTTNFYDGIPTFERPTAVGTSVTASLQNISGKTTDAKALVTTRAFLTGTITSGTFFTTLTETGAFQHADATDRTGVPVIDGADAGAFEACYVEIIDLNTEAALEVQSGSFAGQRIFGLTFASSGSEPNSVGVKFMRVAKGGNIADASNYSWEAGLPLTASFFYGYRQRLDQLDDTALRRIMVNGIVGDADMAFDITDIRTTIGIGDNVTSLSGLLTNTGNYFPFVNLPDATPSVVEALNTLNTQIGNRDYTGSILTDGQTITASLQALANAIAGSQVKRTIERVGSDINAGVAHTVPGGQSYTIGAMSGSGLMVMFWRGVLKDPGTVVNGDDYDETSTTSFTPFTKIKAGDHINYFIYT